MPKPVDLSFMDDVGEEDPADFLRALPEIRHDVAPASADDDFGLRSLLESPAAFTHTWWLDQARRSSGVRAIRRSAPWRAA